jgi:hypothetical protein
LKGKSVRKRKYERKAAKAKAGRKLRSDPFDPASFPGPGLKKLRLVRRMAVEAALLGRETLRIAGPHRFSQADLAKARKALDQELAERRRSKQQLTKDQLFIARIEELRANGEKDPVAVAGAEFGLGRSGAYKWRKRIESLQKSTKSGRKWTR